jgi:hypothetical protein
MVQGIPQAQQNYCMPSYKNRQMTQCHSKLYGSFPLFVVMKIFAVQQICPFKIHADNF